MSIAWTSTPTRSDDYPDDHIEVDAQMSLRSIEEREGYLA